MKTASVGLSMMLALGGAGVALAQPAAKVDLYGDPLPVGAVARLGTMQMRRIWGGDSALLPDNKTLVIAGQNRLLRYWDIVSGKLLREKIVGEGAAESVALSSDGKALATLIANRWTFWDIETNKVVGTWATRACRRQWPVFWDDQLFAVLRQDDRLVLLREQKTGQERTIKIPRTRPGENSGDSAFHATVSPDKRWLAGLGGHGEPLNIVDLSTGEVTHRLSAAAYCSTFTRDSKQLIFCDVEIKPGDKAGAFKGVGTIRFVDVVSGKEIKSFKPTDGAFYTLAASTDGKKLACCFSDDSVVIDCDTGRVIYKLPGRPIEARWTPDGQTLIVAYGYRYRIWDTKNWQERFLRPGEMDSTPALAVSPDGKTLAAGGWMNQTVTLWDLAAGKVLRELPLKGDRRYVRDLSFSADGRMVTASQMKNYHQWWEAATGRELGEIQADRETEQQGRQLEPYCYRAFVTPDRAHVSTLDRRFDGSGESTRFARWDARTGQAVAEHRLHGAVRDVVWFEDGTEFVACAERGLGRIRLTDGSERWRVPAVREGKVVSTPGRELIAAQASTAYAGAVVGVWESATGMQVTLIELERVDHFALTGDCRRLVATDVSTLRVWDLATRQEIVRYALPDAHLSYVPAGTIHSGLTVVMGLVVTPDGKRAVTSLSDGTALVWDIDRRPAVLAKRATEEDLQRWWTNLGWSIDGPTIYGALWRMSEAPSDAVVAFLRKKLPPVASPDAAVLTKWIAQLDDAKFAARDRASRELEALGPPAFPALRKLLSGNPSPEAAKRANELLAKAPAPDFAIREVRAVQLLARLEGAAAREHLRALAGGAAEHPVTRAAQAAIEARAR